MTEPKPNKSAPRNSRAGGTTPPSAPAAATAARVSLYLRGALVALSGFSFHLFHWFHRKPQKLVLLLGEGALRPADWRSFARSAAGFTAGAVALWIGLSWLAARKRKESLRETLARGSTAFFVCLVLAPLAFIHYWPSLRDTISFLVRTTVTTAFVVALARAYGGDVWGGFGDRPLWRRPAFWAGIVGVLASTDLAICSIVKFHRFATHIDDLGLYDQMCWGLIHGYGFLTTIYDLPRDNFLAEHIVPTVAVVAQIYRLWEDPRILLILQSLALAAGGLLVYRIARKRTSTAWFPFLLTVAYFVNPLLERGWMNDFHVDALEVFLYLAAYACLLRGAEKRAWSAAYWVLIVLLLGCKEDVGLSVAALGLVVAAAQRRRLLGLSTAAVGLAWSYVAITKLLPHFASAGGAAVEVNRQIANYSHLGSNIPEIALSPILHPLRVLGAVLLPERVVSVLKVLMPVGFLPLFAPLWLILLGPSYLTTILSGWEGQYGLHSHYGLVFVAPAFIAAVEGWRNLESGRLGLKPKHLGTAALIVACLSLSAANKFRKFRLTRPLKWTRAYRTHVDRSEVLKVGEKIPPYASLSADEALGSHFSRRRYIYKFPRRPEGTRFVLLNFDKPNPLGPDRRAEFRATVEQWILRDGYGIRKLRGETLLLEKGYRGGNQKALFEKVTSKLAR